MKRSTRHKLGLAAALGAAWLIWPLTGSAQEREEIRSAGAVEEVLEGEVLLRGPVHEAFAEPVGFDPRPGIVVRQQPPEPVEEIPPPVKPDGEAVLWIPGYWAWDDERNGFIWVSGIWRTPPPDRRWVPGYWTEVDEGYQWISGVWVPEEDREIIYLPYPPESLERGPTVPQPSPNHYWVAGTWQFRDGRYVWQPGYWAPFVENWVWVPSYYTWTPRGAICTNGYWDYPLANRGTLFAPVYFNGPVRRAARFAPAVIVRTASLLVNMFVNRNAGQYYWGDYYGNYPGFYSPYDYHLQYGYDPLFAYNDAYYVTQGVNYADRLQYWHNFFLQNEAYRPPRTLQQQLRFADQFAANDGLSNDVLRYAMLGMTLNQVLNDGQAIRGFQQLPMTERQTFAQAANQIARLIDRRVQVETQAAGEAAIATEQEPRAGRDDADPATAGRNAEGQADARAALQLPETTPGRQRSESAATPGPDPSAIKEVPNPRRDRAEGEDELLPEPPGRRDPRAARTPGRPNAERGPRESTDAEGAARTDRPGRPQPAPENAEQPDNAPRPDRPMPRSDDQADPDRPERNEPPAAERGPRRGPEPRRGNRGRGGDPEAQPMTPETPRPEAPPSESPLSENPRPEVPPPENPRPENPRPENPRPETPMGKAPRSDAPRPEIPRPEIPRPETLPSETLPSEALPSEAPRPERSRPEGSRPEAPRGKVPQADTPRPETVSPSVERGRRPLPKTDSSPVPDRARREQQPRAEGSERGREGRGPQVEGRAPQAVERASRERPVASDVARPAREPAPPRPEARPMPTPRPEAKAPERSESKRPSPRPEKQSDAPKEKKGNRKD